MGTRTGGSGRNRRPYRDRCLRPPRACLGKAALRRIRCRRSRRQSRCRRCLRRSRRGSGRRSGPGPGFLAGHGKACLTAVESLSTVLGGTGESLLKIICHTSSLDLGLMGRLRPISSPRPPSRGPASVLAAAPDRGPGQAPAAEPVLHRLRWRRKPEMGPGSGAGATLGVASPSVPVNDRWYQAFAFSIHTPALVSAPFHELEARHSEPRCVFGPVQRPRSRRLAEGAAAASGGLGVGVGRRCGRDRRQVAAAFLRRCRRALAGASGAGFRRRGPPGARPGEGG